MKGNPKMKKEFNLKYFLIATLRRSTYRYLPREECRRAAKVSRGKYMCRFCEKIVARKDTKIDHILPVINPVEGFVSWDKYIERMFCGQEGFQLLCKECHDRKTKVERAIKQYINFMVDRPEMEDNSLRFGNADGYYNYLYSLFSKDSDISKCSSKTCPIRNGCYRFLVAPSFHQSYSKFKYNKKECVCKNFLSVE
jgi:hypothetical protein